MLCIGFAAPSARDVFFQETRQDGDRKDGPSQYRAAHGLMSVKLPTRVGNQKFESPNLFAFHQLHREVLSPRHVPGFHLLDAVRSVGLTAPMGGDSPRLWKRQDGPIQYKDVRGFKSGKLPTHVGNQKFIKFKNPKGFFTPPPPHTLIRKELSSRHGPGGHLLDAM